MDPQSETTLRKTQLACIVVTAILLTALWANAPYLIQEHSRLEMWKVIGLLSSDLVGLFWFLRFFVAHGVMAEPLVSIRVEDGRARVRRLMVVSIIAIVLDFGFTLSLTLHERVTYERSVTVTAEAVDLKRHPRELAIGFDLDCRFKDATGKEYTVRVRALAPQYQFPAAMPPETIALLNGTGTNRHSVLLRYDPTFPRRAWLEGMGWEDENGIYWFSFGALALQSGITLLFLLQLFQHSKLGVFPWWWDTYKILPLASEALCMLMMGGIERLMDAFHK